MVWEFFKEIIDAAFSDVNEKLAEFNVDILNQPAGAFGETPSEIDRQHVLMLAYLCHLAYVAFRSGEEAVREALIAPNTPIGLYRTQASFFTSDEQYVSFSVCSDTDLVFVLRGSADIRDWLQNICTALMGNEQIHAGFDRVAEQLWPWVIQTAKQRLSEPHNTTNRIIFTGHSLGGAVAVLLSHRLEQMQIVLPKSTAIEAYTFGCPKIGSEALNLNYPLIAFRAIGDMIPEITVTTTYQPHGRGYLLTDRFQIITAPDAALMGLLNWGRMLGDIANRRSYLMHTFASEASENEV